MSLMEQIENHPEWHILPIEKLTDRELEVIELIRKGFTTPMIAAKLYISPGTVNTHRKSLRRKFPLNGLKLSAIWNGVD